MAKKFLWIGMLVNVLVFGITVIACTKTKPNAGAVIDVIQVDKSINGSWVLDGFEISLKDGKFEEFIGEIPWRRGSYTTDDGKITVVPTHVFGEGFNTLFGISENESGIESKWYTINDFISAFKSALIKMGLSESEAEKETNDFVNAFHSANSTSFYNLSGNILYLTNDGVTQNFTRK